MPDRRTYYSWCLMGSALGMLLAAALFRDPNLIQVAIANQLGAIWLKIR